MTEPTLESVPVLIPARFHRTRAEVASATMAGLSAWIEALPTANHRGELADADTATAKAWALDVIRALPTQGTGDGNIGILR